MRCVFIVMTALFTTWVANTNGQEVFKFSGELRMRAEVRDNADFNSDRLDGTVQVFQRLRFAAAREFEHGLKVFVQLQDSRLWGEEGSSLNALNNVDLHQAYLQIDKPAALPFDIRLGRQPLSFGSERLLGKYDWHNIGRAFNALNVQWGSAQQQLNFWLAQVRDHTAPTVARNQEFAGAYFTSQRLLPFTLEAYWLLLYDARNFESIANPATPGRQDEPSETLDVHTLGLRLSRARDRGLQFDFEGAYQFGGRGFQSIRAYGLALEASYTLASKWRPSLRAGYVLGSGDEQVDDNRSETFSNLFPNAHGFLGAMDYASWSNISAPYAGLSFVPKEKLAFGIDYYLLALHNDHDAWYRAGGFNIGTPQEFYRKAVAGAGKRLGHEIDVHLDYLYRERLDLKLGLSKFFVGEFIEKTGGLRADDSVWGYFALEVKF
ncbi:alginate export family protein [candidate division KSB1 bacterium]|nr:alginate export family protein [candidate division KSB1 bacterium]